MEKSATLSPVKQALLEQRLKRASHKRVRGREIPKRPDRDSAPLSFTQHQMWVIDQITPGNPAYNLPYGYRLRGRLDSVALEESFNALIKRHETLRTTFAIKDGEPLQLIHPELKISLNVTALDHLTDEEREDRLQALASEESVKSFDLSRLPLIRVSLFKLGEAEHVLIINLHHIVADGLSIRLLLNELDTFYRAFTEGGDPCPPELVVQYGDFTLWQRQTIANEAAYAKQIEFWRTQLGGSLSVLELPSDRPRPALQSFNGSNVFFNIPTALAQDLKSLGEREGCTFFMTVLAAFQVLLHRYSGAEDIIIGTPVATRNPSEVEPLIGLIINIAALRCQLSGNPTFIELLRRTRDTTLNVFSNSDLPFEFILKQLKFERDPSRNPIFQVALQVLSNTAPRIGDLDISSFHFDLKFAQFDLTLHLYEEAGGYQGRFEYCSDLFHPQTIKRLSQNFLQLLHVIARDPDQKISTLPMLTDAERYQILEVWNQRAVAYPAARCVHDLVAEQARICPDALAAESGGRQLSYRELDERAESLAGRLCNHGVQADSLVAIYLERSIEMLVGLLAVWKAGAAYVPIDLEYPAERVRFVLEDTKAVVVLTQKSLSGALPVTDSAVVHLDAEENRVAASSGGRAPRSSWSPEKLAYVIYTSGSTGRPKGVPIKHTSLFNLICWHQQAYQVTPADRATQIAGSAFDASVWEIWPYLTAGASVHIPDDSTRLDGRELVRWLADRQITLAFLPTPLAESALRENWLQTAALRVLLTGGDRLNQRPRRKLPFRLVNHYGPTENTVVSTCAEVEEGISNAAPPIGRPLPNTQAYVLDRHLQPSPIGVPGELVLGGVQLTSGYWNRPDLTAEKFIPNPFRAEPGTRLYKTGDLVRLLPDGNLEFLGRIDSQIKIRGFRIELGEIESALSQHPAIREVVVLAREHLPGDKRLVAYIVPNREPAPAIRELRSFLKGKLPYYMVPSAYVLLDSLPLTPNGKVDRRALPDPGRTEQQDYNEYVAPRDETERVLCRVWSEVLGVHRVGLDDDFFAIGGHSLLAAKLFARLDEEFGRSLSLGVLFTAPTVRLLAECYRTSVGSKGSSVIVPLSTGGTLPPVFAVPGVFGNVVGFEALARELGSEQPFYGLQSVGLDGTEAPLDSIGEMAKLYLTEMRSVHPGPYAIIGACFGATVAYEMARQLLEEGEEVAFLGLLGPTDREGKDDSENRTSLPRTCRRTMAFGNFLTDRLNLYLEEMQELSIRDRIKYLTSKTLSLATSIGVKKGFRGAQRELNQIEVYRANLVALGCYHRKSLHGRLRVLEIFQPVVPGTEMQEPINWKEFWKGCTKVHHVGGKDSGDMLSARNVPVIAALLSERLRAAFAEEWARQTQVSKGARN